MMQEQSVRSFLLEISIFENDRKDKKNCRWKWNQVELPISVT